MLEPAPENAICALHAGHPARWVCPRCGSFFCALCERRTRPDALPMCATCWDARERSVGPQVPEKPSTALQTAGLVLGCLAVLPIPGLQLAALVVGILGVTMAKTPAARAVRKRSIIGLCLVGVGLGVDVVLFGLLT